MFGERPPEPPAFGTPVEATLVSEGYPRLSRSELALTLATQLMSANGTAGNRSNSTETTRAADTFLRWLKDNEENQQ